MDKTKCARANKGENELIIPLYKTQQINFVTSVDESCLQNVNACSMNKELSVKEVKVFVSMEHMFSKYMKNRIKASEMTCFAT